MGERVTDASKLRVLVAEDQALVRQGIVALLELDAGEVIEVDNGEDALRQLISSTFDVALLDIGLPRRTGIDVMKEVRQRQLPVKIIILTGDTASYAPSTLYEQGADGFVYKTADADKLLETFTNVVAGRDVPGALPEDGQDALSIAEKREQLTERELQIIKVIVEGASNKEAADILHISEHTVRKHREHINRKLNVGSPAALAAFAIKAGLV